MLVNGQHQEYLSVTDRALHYGDGLFETVLVRARRPVLWASHLQRLQTGCKRLNIPLDLDSLKTEVAQLLAEQPLETGVLKILVSRGSGGRGYMPPATPQSTRLLQWHPLPQDYAQHASQGVHVRRCQHPLSVNPALAGLKHLNRLDQVLASQELGSEVQEGLMCDPGGALIEGIKSNVFLHNGTQWLTPALQHCGVAGVMRNWLLQTAAPVAVRALKDEEILAAEEMFVCNSVFGIWPVTRLQWGSQTQDLCVGNRTRQLQTLFEECRE